MEPLLNIVVRKYYIKDENVILGMIKTIENIN